MLQRTSTTMTQTRTLVARGVTATDTLQANEKARRLDVSKKLLQLYETSPNLLSRLVIGDKMTIVGKGFHDRIKMMLYYDVKGPLLLDFVPILPDQFLAGGVSFPSLLRQLRQNINDRETGNIKPDDPDAVLVAARKRFLLTSDQRKSSKDMTAVKKHNFIKLLHAPYSSDLLPSTYHVFPELHTYLYTHRFADDGAVVRAVLDWLDAQSPEFYEYGIQQLPSKWLECVNRCGGKLRGD